MSTSVAAPLERQFGQIAGVTEMTSVSSRGSANIILQFELNRSIDGAARDVQAAINASRGFLPTNLPNNPTYRKVNPSDAPILILALTSDTVDRSRMFDVASTILQQKLSQLKGVGEVTVGGSSLPAVRVELNPMVLNRYGISTESVRGTLAANNANRPKGQLANGERTWQIQANDQLSRAEQYLPLIISHKAGAAVRLSDVAQVIDSVEDVRSIGLSNGKSAITLIIFRQPEANIIETVDNITSLLPKLKAALPEGVDLSVVSDRTQSIRGSLLEVEKTMMISGLLVVLVVFAFLRSLRATIIPAIAVIVSIVSTFAVMYLCGYSLNNLSLMALTIATGFVVDDAIVVLENITRHREMGQSPLQAALSGSKEVSFTVLSMSVSLVAVFIPILMMGGMVGRLFREFAVTLSAAIMVSLVVSLTLTPMMCATFLKPIDPSGCGPLFRSSERFFNMMRNAYERSLSRALRHSRMMLMVIVGTVILTVYLFIIIPKGFFPEQDTGRISGNIRASQDISFQAMSAKLAEIASIINDDPDVENTLAFTGRRGSANNDGRIFISLKPFKKRTISAQQVIGRLRKKLSGVVGAQTILQPVQDLRVGGRGASAMYQYTLQGEDLTLLNEWAPRMLEKMRTLPGLADANTDQQNKGLEVKLEIDRTAASRLGITPKLLDNTLYDAFGQRQVAVSYTLLNQYHVVMEVAPKFWQNPDTLHEIHVIAESGARVPLSAFTCFETKPTSLTVNHQGQFPSVTLSFNLLPGYSLGDAVRLIEKAKHDIGFPSGIRGSFQGTAQAFKSSLSSQPLLILGALITVYIVLGILYESYIHPITILSTLPSAGMGAALALFAFRTDMSLIAMIGVILLIGIVKKNGIMMVDFALQAERERGKKPEEAIFEACLRRFRPIMMTTMAALLGALPLAMSSSVGSELRRPLGVAIVGGLIFSQMMTLYTTPVVYLYMDRFRVWLDKKRAGSSQSNSDPDQTAVLSAEQESI